MPKISVVMPVYNGEKYLKEAVDSILNQTFSDFEFIIIDDGSTDNTESIIKSYADNRIRYIKNEKNCGVAESLNKGIDFAQGEYIARMDADDISLPQRFEKQVKFMDRSRDIAVCGSSMMTFGEVQEKRMSAVSDNEEIKIKFIFTSCLFHPTVMMRRNVVEKEHYRYDVNYDKVEDFELWTRIMCKYKISNIKSVLLKYRVHKNQVTRNYNEKYRQLLEEIKQKYLKSVGICLNAKEIRALNEYFLEIIDYDNETKDLISAFLKIIEENKKSGYFNEKKLRKKFAKISLNAIKIQNSYEKRELLEKAAFITVLDVQKDNFKNLVKRIIGAKG